MSQLDPFLRIIEEGKCIGCGLCKSMYPDKLKMSVAPNGYLRPQQSRKLSANEVAAIYAVCPGVVHSGLPESLASRAPEKDDVWGPHFRIDMLYAADPRARHRAATGGALTALAQYLLHSGIANKILHVRSGGRQPSFGQPQRSRTAADALDAAASVYGQASPLEQLLPMLDEGEPFAVVAKPCDISAVRRLGRTDARVGKLVTHCLTMMCGGLMPPFGMDAFLERYGVRLQDVASISYRGNGCPGPTRIELKSGKVIEKTYLEFWGSDSSMWHLPWRCKICPDGTGEAADVAAADTWPDGSPTEQMMAEDPGTNVVVSRTAAGNKLVADAIAAGFLERSGPAKLDDLSSWQPHLVRKKRAAEARYDGMEQRGQLRLDTPDLRTAALRSSMSAADDEAQVSGTISRIDIGKHRDDFGT